MNIYDVASCFDAETAAKQIDLALQSMIREVDSVIVELSKKEEYFKNGYQVNGVAPLLTEESKVVSKLQTIKNELQVCSYGFQAEYFKKRYDDLVSCKANVDERINYYSNQMAALISGKSGNALTTIMNGSSYQNYKTEKENYSSKLTNIATETSKALTKYQSLVKNATSLFTTNTV